MIKEQFMAAITHRLKLHGLAKKMMNFADGVGGDEQLLYLL